MLLKKNKGLQSWITTINKIKINITYTIILTDIHKLTTNSWIFGNHKNVNKYTGFVAFLFLLHNPKIF